MQEPLRKAEANHSLEDFDLTVEDLHYAVREATILRDSCGPNHAPSAKGTYSFHETVNHLRIKLKPRGWATCDKGNYSRVIHPDGFMSIAVSGGDINTGNPDAFPCTVSSKGERTKQVIAENQLLLFSTDEIADSFPRESGRHQTWYLLYHFDLDETRLELSLPVNLDRRGKISTWRERIYLPAIPTEMPFTLDHSEIPDPEVKVERRREA